jgi:hypothetical protein
VYNFFANAPRKVGAKKSCLRPLHKKGNAPYTPVMRLLKYFRFSLRTLALLMITGGAGTALWHNFQPWRVEKSFMPQFSGEDNRVSLSQDGEWIVQNASGEEGGQRFHRASLWNIYTHKEWVIVDHQWPAEKEERHWACYNLISKDGQWLFSTTNNGQFHRYKLLQVNTMKEVAIPVLGYDSEVYGVFSPNSSHVLLLKPESSFAQLIELNEMKTIFKRSDVKQWRFSHDGEYLFLITLDDEYLVLNPITGELVRTIPKQPGWESIWVPSTAKNRFVATAFRTEFDWFDARDAGACCIMVFDHQNPEPLVTLHGNFKGKSDDGQFLAYFFDGTWHVHDILNNKPMYQWRDASDNRVMIWSHDNSVALHMGYNPSTVTLRDNATGNTLVEYSDVMMCRPSKDFSRLLCKDSEKRVSIRNTLTGDILQKFPKGTLLDPWDGFSSDGLHFVSQNSESKRIQYWTRYRPEEWGVAYLVEFWLTLLLAGATVWSVVKDRRGIARRL